MTLRQKLPNETIIITFEVTKSKFDTFLVNFLEQSSRLIITLRHKVELPIGQVFLTHEEVSKVREIFEEGALHEGDLVVNAGQLRDFVDEVKQGLRDADDLIIHDLE